jgi:Flp pilus assembly protein TadB
VFRRTKTETDPAASEATSEAVRPGVKGRPTPTRKEAEAAARARAKAPRNRKEMAARQRQQRTEQSRKVRQAMKDGDERYFMPRDQGPVRKFLRDYVDSRFSFLEIMIPVMVLTLVLGYSGVPALMRVGNLVLLGMFFLIIFDILMLRFRVRRELGRRFPEASTKGTTFYAVSRSMQMKFMRLPKPQVRIGERLPERYR